MYIPTYSTYSTYTANQSKYWREAHLVKKVFSFDCPIAPGVSKHSDVEWGGGEEWRVGRWEVGGGEPRGCRKKIKKKKKKNYNRSNWESNPGHRNQNPMCYRYTIQPNFWFLIRINLFSFFFFPLFPSSSSSIIWEGGICTRVLEYYLLVSRNKGLHKVENYWFFLSCVTSLTPEECDTRQYIGNPWVP